MSKKDRERATAGTVFRDGQLVATEDFSEQKRRAKMLLDFVSKRRLPLQKGDLEFVCPSCGEMKPLTARRMDGKVEHLCRKCYFMWESPKEKIRNENRYPLTRQSITAPAPSLRAPEEG